MEWLRLPGAACPGESNTRLVLELALGSRFRKGPGNLDNIGYSDAIGQLASIAISLEEDKGVGERSDNISFKILRVIKGREGESGAIQVKYDMNYTQIDQTTILEGPGAQVEDYDRELD